MVIKHWSYDGQRKAVLRQNFLINNLSHNMHVIGKWKIFCLLDMTITQGYRTLSLDNYLPAVDWGYRASTYFSGWNFPSHPSLVMSHWGRNVFGGLGGARRTSVLATSSMVFSLLLKNHWFAKKKILRRIHEHSEEWILFSFVPVRNYFVSVSGLWRAFKQAWGPS